MNSNMETVEQEGFRLPLKSLQWLKENSPSRAHGVTEETEREWKRNCVNLIIRVGQSIEMCVSIGTGKAVSIADRQVLQGRLCLY